MGSMGFSIYAQSGFTASKNFYPEDVLGNWFHYCAVWDAAEPDSSKIVVYKDGEKQPYTSSAHTVASRTATNHVMMLGHPNENGGGSYMLDELYIWEEKLSDSQIADLYNAY